MFFFVRFRYLCVEFGRESYFFWWEDNGYREWEWDFERRENKNRDRKRGFIVVDLGMYYIMVIWFIFFKNIVLVICRCLDFFLDVVILLNLFFFLYL